MTKVNILEVTEEVSKVNILEVTEEITKLDILEVEQSQSQSIESVELEQI